MNFTKSENNSNKKRKLFNDLINVNDIGGFETSKNDMASNAATLQTSSIEDYFLHYNMDHSKRGIAVIFNQEFLATDLGLHTHINSTYCTKLVDTLNNLGFEIWECQNYIYENVISTLKNVAKMDHSEHDCLIVVVLSYGNNDYLYAADSYYEVDVLFNCFTAKKCPTLVGKPKLFFIQTFYTDKFISRSTSSKYSLKQKKSDATFRIEPDYLIIHSIIPGYHSSSVIHGTCFLEQLSFQLRENGTRYDLITLLTLVWQGVPKDFEILAFNNLTLHYKKQLPRIISTLMHFVKFTPKLLPS